MTVFTEHCNHSFVKAACVRFGYTVGFVNELDFTIKSQNISVTVGEPVASENSEMLSVFCS